MAPNKVYKYKLLCVVLGKQGIAKVRLLNENAMYRQVGYDEFMRNVADGKWEVTNVENINEEEISKFPTIYLGGITSTMKNLIYARKGDDVVVVTTGGTARMTDVSTAEELIVAGLAYDPEKLVTKQ